MNNKVELLAPAGDLEKLKMAIIYGADAVYLGGERFGLRAAAKNFTIEQIKEGVEFAHERGKRVFVTINMIPHNDDFVGFEEYLKELESVNVDAFILSDPGVLDVVKEVTPNMEIHLSTQANNTNYRSAKFWEKQGVKRIVVARELSLREIRQIKDNIKEETEIEAFVHGAMCMSYSGRCLISNYMTGKNANQGECKHPCRWKYYLVEEQRPGEYYPVYEDERGTFFFNSKDLCMIDEIPALLDAGITSLKIEGRMKSAYYVATVIRAYRMAIDSYLNDPTNYKFDENHLKELKKVSHRDFTKGFYYQKPDDSAHHYGSSSYLRGYDFISLCKEELEDDYVLLEQRNKFFKGEELEVMPYDSDELIMTKVLEIYDYKSGEALDDVPQPKRLVKVKLDKKIKKDYILRREQKDGK